MFIPPNATPAQTAATVNGQLDETNLRPQTRIPLVQTTVVSGLASTLQRGAMYVQSITTDALTNNQVTYRGWGYKDCGSITTGTIVITLPNSGFNDINYTVNAVYLGEKATTPTTRADITSHKVHAVTNIVGSATSATQFTISFYSNGGGNFTFVVFDWMATGTKAA